MQNYQLGILVKKTCEVLPLHVFEEILCALHKDNPFERRVLAHDSAAAVRSYDELTQSDIILELDQVDSCRLTSHSSRPFRGAIKISQLFN